MGFENFWEKALKHTEILRSRIQPLQTLNDTSVPYILLSESSVNQGDTVVRKGDVLIERPALIVPPNHPQFRGFEFSSNQSDEQSIINFFVIRGVSFPSLKYDNHTSTLEIFEGGLSKAIKHYQDHLQQNENVHAGLISGPEDCWQFSLLIFVCSQILRNANHDIKKLFDEFKKFKQ